MWLAAYPAVSEKWEEGIIYFCLHLSLLQVMVTNVTSLLKTVKAVEDEATRGTRALEATIEYIKQELTVQNKIAICVSFLKVCSCTQTSLPRHSSSSYALLPCSALGAIWFSTCCKSSLKVQLQCHFSPCTFRCYQSPLWDLRCYHHAQIWKQLLLCSLDVKLSLQIFFWVQCCSLFLILALVMSSQHYSHIAPAV